MHPTSLIQNSFTNDLIETINSKSGQKYTEKGETGETGQIGETGEIEEKEEVEEKEERKKFGEAWEIGKTGEMEEKEENGQPPTSSLRNPKFQPEVHSPRELQITRHKIRFCQQPMANC